MLSPGDRRLLLEALRPPLGYKLARAIGATYSLDLLSLLLVPLAFSLFDTEDDEGEPTEDPLALLEALRLQADRMTVFAHAGKIQVPGRRHPLLAFLEDSVIEVLPPDPTKAFHPKIWILRFTGGDPTFATESCTTRNITFDRRTPLVLKGACGSKEGNRRQSPPRRLHHIASRTRYPPAHSGVPSA